MKKPVLFFLVAALFAATFSACGSANTMTLTLEPFREVKIYLAGVGAATIDWGDGSPIEKHDLLALDMTKWEYSGDNYEFSHTYPGTTAYTITITGEITLLGAWDLVLTNLDVSRNNALTYLDCSGGRNKLTSFDVSKNTALTYLACRSMGLTSLDVSKNIALTELYCNENQLTILDVSKNTSLKKLHCSNNRLTNLNVNAAILLEDLTCTNNQLTNLDVSKNTALLQLTCSSNQLTSLDVSRNIALKFLNFTYNQLTSLDLSSNVALVHISCNDNQLTSLDVSNCEKLRGLLIHNNRLSASALNSLFGTLPQITGGMGISISRNPGANTCNRKIAEDKGWSFL